MQENRCPTCGKMLPEFAQYCARCGETAPSEETTISLKGKYIAHQIATISSEKAASEDTSRIEKYSTTQISSSSLNASPHALPSEEESNTWLLKSIEGSVTLKLFRADVLWTGLIDEDLLASSGPELEDLEDEVVERRATWQKVVEKTPHKLPVVQSFPPYKRSGSRYGMLKRPFLPQVVFWLGLLAALALLLGGGFGIALSFGKVTPPALPTTILTLQVTPSRVAMGGIVTLRGTHVTQNGQIGLSRDKQIPLVDTGGVSTIRADAHGLFSDTVIVDPLWLPGDHFFNVTDLHTNQQAMFKVTVTGQNILRGPPHLLLSSSALDLGTGDQTTNGSQLLALSNAGGGQVNWQAKVTQPWLQVSPQSGSIPSGAHISVVVGGDRSQLDPGNYSGQIILVSNTEQLTLTVTIGVTPLQESHEAILQVSTVTMDFSATANGPDPLAQTLTVSDPGIQPLDWQAAVTDQTNGPWLSLTPASGTIDPQGQQEISVGVNSEGLAPGVYRNVLLFSSNSDQPVQDSPRRVYISLTIAPFCALTFTKNDLTFTNMVGHAAPPAQSLQVGVVQECTQPQHWSASVRTISGGQWLQVAQFTGSTPTSLQVSVNPGTLGPGTYRGSIMFTSDTGQQLIQITLTINPIPCSVSGSTSPINLQGTAGQTGLSSQNAILITGGTCSHPLDWHGTASVSTTSSGTWLSVTASGTTSASHTDILVSANLAGLSAATYTGTVTITVVDSSTGQMVGSVQFPVQLTVLPLCQLQAASKPQLAFSSNVGSNPAVATLSFTVNVTGNCSGTVTITPSINASDMSWLALSTPVTLNSGDTATFNVTVTSTTLIAGPYSSTILLSAADGNGVIAGSAQKVVVSLTIS